MADNYSVRVIVTADTAAAEASIRNLSRIPVEVNVTLPRNVNRTLGAMERRLTRISTIAPNVGRGVSTIGAGMTSIANANQNLGNMNRAINQVSTSMTQGTRASKGYFSSLMANAKTNFAAQSLQAAFYQTIRLAKEAAQAAVDVDSSLVGLKRVTDFSEGQYANMFDEMKKAASDYGVVLSDIIDMTSSWSRAGYATQAVDLAKTTSMYEVVAEVDAKEASKNLLTAYKGFENTFNEQGYESISDSVAKITDVYNELDNNYSITAGDLGEGMARTAAMLQQAGASFEESAAMITGATEVTQDAVQAGQALKISSMRIRGMKGALEELGEEVDDNVVSVSKMQTHVLNLTHGKVNIFDNNGDFRNIYDVFNEIASIKDELDDTEFADLIETISGKHRANTINSMLNNWGRTQQALNSALNSDGSAEREYDKYLDSIQAHLNQVQASFQGLSSVALSKELVNGVVLDNLKKFLDLLTDIGELANEGHVGGIAAIAAMFSALGAVTGTGSKKFSGKVPIMNGSGDAWQRQLANGRLRTGIRASGGSALRAAAVDSYERTMVRQFGGTSAAWADRNNQAVALNNARTTYRSGLYDLSREDSFRAFRQLRYEAANTMSGNLLQGDTARERLRQLEAQLGKTSAAYRALNATQTAFANSSRTAAIQATALFTAFKGLEALKGFGAMMGNMAVNMGVMLAVMGVITLVTNLMHQQEDAINKAKDSMQDYKETIGNLNSNKSSFKSNVETYTSAIEQGKVTSLGENVSMATDEYEEFLSVRAAIAEQTPELVAGYDKEGNAIIKSGLNRQDYIDAYNKRIKDANDKVLGYGTDKDDITPAQIDAAIQGYRDNVKKASKDGKKLANELANSQDILETIDNASVDDLASIAKSLGIGRERNWMETEESYKNEISQKVAEYAQSNREGLVNLASDYTDAIEQSNDYLSTLANAMVSNQFLDSGAYADMSDKMQGMISQSISSIKWGEVADGAIDSKNGVKLVVNKMLEVFNTQDFENALNFKSAFDEGAISAGVYKARLDTVLKSIDGLDAATKETIYTTFGVKYEDGKDPSEMVLKDVESLRNNLLSSGYEASIADRWIGQLSGNDITTAAGINYDLYYNVHVDTDNKANELAKALSEYSEGGSVDLLMRPVIDSQELEDAGWKNVEDGIATTYARTYALSDFDKNIKAGSDKDKALNLTPIMTDGSGHRIGVMTPKELKKYAKKVLKGGLSADEGKLQIGAVFEGKDAKKDAEETIEDIQKIQDQYSPYDRQSQLWHALEVEKALSKGGDIDVSSETKSITNLNAALKESISATGLTAESIDAIKSRYSSFKSYDEKKLFEETANGIRLNSAEMSRLESKYASSKLDAQTKKLKTMRVRYGELVEQIRNATDESQRAELITERDRLRDRINDVADLAAQYQGLASAYNKWQSTEANGNERDMYDTVLGGFDTVKEELSRGWLDDGSKEFIQLLSGKDLSTASTKEYLAVWDDINNKVVAAGHTVKDFFTKDANGKSTNEGVYNFLEAAEAKGFNVKRDKSGNIIGWDFGINGQQAVADTMSMSEEVVQIIERAGRDAGFVVNFDGAYTQFSDLKSAADDAAKYLAEIGKTEMKFKLDETSIGGVEKELAEAQRIVDAYKSDSKNLNEDGTLNLDIDGAKEAMTLLTELITAKQNLEKPSYMNIDTSQLETQGEKDAVDKLKEWHVQKNKQEILSLNGTKEQIKEAEEETEKLGDQFIELAQKSPEILMQLDWQDMTPEEMKAAMESESFDMSAKLSIETETKIDNKLNAMLAKLAFENGDLSYEEYRLIVKAAVDTSSVAKAAKDAEDEFDAQHPTGKITVETGGGGTEFSQEAANLREKANQGTVDESILNVGVVSTSKFANAIKSMSGTQVDIVLNAMETGDSEKLFEAYKSLDDKQISLVCQAYGVQTVDELGKKLKGTNSKNIKLVAKALGQQSIEKTNSLIKDAQSKKVNVTVDSDNTELERTINGLSLLKDKKITVTTKVSTQYDNDTGLPLNNGKKKSGGHDVNGTAHVNGTAFAGGNWGAKNSGTALMGELGPELVVDSKSGTWKTVGDNGAGFYKYNRGDIIFNHRQTEELFKNGTVTSGGGRGRALVRGTAFAHGVAFDGGTGGGVGKVVVGGGGGDDKKTDKANKSASAFKDTLDLVEIKLNNIQRAIDKLDSKASNTFDTWKNRTTNLNSEISETKKQITQLGNARKSYLAYANKVARGSSATKEEKSGLKKAKDAKKKAGDKLSKSERKAVEKTVGKSDKKANKELKTLAKGNKKKLKELKTYRDKVKKYNTANKKYNTATKAKEKKGLGLTSKTKKMIQEGQITGSSKDIMEISKKLTGNDEEAAKLLAEKIKDYKTWWDKATDQEKAMLDAKQKLRELYEQRFDNLKTRYDNVLTTLDNNMSIIDTRRNTAETHGYAASAEYYKGQKVYNDMAIDYNMKAAAALERERQYQMKKGGLEKYSEKWYEYTDGIQKYIQAAEDAKEKNEELLKSIRDIENARFDSVTEGIQRFADEADYVVNMLSNRKLVEDNGALTDEGTTTMAMYYSKYEAHMSNVARLNDEIAKKQEEYDKSVGAGEANEELRKRIEELKDARMQDAEAANQEMSNVKALVEEGINNELSSLQKLIDEHNKAIDAKKSLYDYNKKIKKQTKEIANLEKQQAAYAGDDSEEAKAKLQKIKVDLEDAKSELEDQQYERFISDSQDMLDDMYEKYSDALNKKLDDIMKLFEDTKSEVAGKQDTINSTLKENLGGTLSNTYTEVQKAVGTDGVNIESGVANAIEGIKGILEKEWSDADKKGKKEAYNQDGHSTDGIVDNAPREDKLPNGGADDNGKKKTPKKKTTPKKKAASNKDAKSSKKNYKVTASSLNVRKGPGKSYDVVKTLSNGSKVAIVEQKNGWGKISDKQWVSMSYLKKYASGVKRAGNELAWTQEKGSEMIVRPSDGAILTPLAKNDSVLSHAMSENIWNMAKNPSDFIKEAVGSLDAGSVAVSDNTKNTYTQNLDKVVFNMPNVKNYEEMLAAMQRDRNFEKLVSSMTINVVGGGSKLGKYKSIV